MPARGRTSQGRAGEGRSAESRGALERRAAWLGFAAVCATYVGLALHYRAIIGPYLIDDAFIYFRYADNLATGHGLVYNPGEPVEGYTGFVWVMLLSLAARLDLPLIPTAQWLGVASGLAALGSTWFAARRLIAPGYWALVAPAFLATQRTFVVWSIEGLETTLFCALLAALLAAWLGAEGGRRWLAVGLTAAALALTRPEGFAFAGLLGLAWASGAQSRVERREVAASAALFVVLTGAHLLFRLAYYGELLPNTFHAKVVGLQPERGFSFLAAAVRDNHVLQYAPLALLGVLIFLAPGRLRPVRAWTVVGSAAYLAYVVAIGGDYFEYRFLAPILPALGLWIAAGSLDVARLAMTAWLRPALTAVATVLWLGANAQVVLAPPRPTPTRTTPESEIEDTRTFVAVGRWLARNLQPDDLIAIGPAGAIAYLSGARCLDMLGLNDREIARRDSAISLGHSVGHQRRVSLAELRARGVTYFVELPRLAPAPAPPHKGRVSIELEPGVFFVMQRLAEDAALEDRTYRLGEHRGSTRGFRPPRR